MKYSLILILFILCCSNIYATELYNNTNLGFDLNEVQSLGSSRELNDDLEQIQTANAEGNIQLLTTQAINLYKLEMYSLQIGIMYGLIVAFIKMVVEISILLVYILEMRLLLYIFIEGIPLLFIKLRDSIGDFIVERRTR